MWQFLLDEHEHFAEVGGLLNSRSGCMLLVGDNLVLA
jgi:hypothetical protein